MKKAVIVDDEKKTRDLIESIILNNFPDIIIADKASSVVEGIKSIVKHQPNIVFLDIEMQDGSGFDILDAIPERNFNFIFVTAYNQYAVRAFKYSAVDYLLKPIDVEEFNFAVEKLLDCESKSKEQMAKFSILKENLQSNFPLKLAVSHCAGYEYINISDIVRLEADGRYTNIYLVNENKITISKALGEFDDLVMQNFFYRTHKSHIVNLQHVKLFNKRDGGHIVMIDDYEVPISRNKRDDFLDKMSILKT